MLFLNDLIWIFSILGITWLIGLTSWPFTKFLVGNKLTDNGLALSHIIGLLVPAYIIFLLATLKLITLAPVFIWLIFICWVLFNLLLEYKYKLIDYRKLDYRQLLITYFIMTVLFLFWYWVRSHGPEIYQIERFMDFGFIQSLFNAQTLPLYDFWLANEGLNYYYFGHFLGFIILTLSNVTTVPGFILLICWLFSVVGVNSYQIGHDIYKYFNDAKTRFMPVLAGLMSLGLVLFAGTMHTAKWYRNYIYKILERPENFSYWYADATRYIDGTITEMPIYGFLVADLHANMWGLLIGVAVITILFVFWKDGNTQLNLKNKYIYIFTFLLGLAYMVNSWDVITLGALVMTFLLYKFRDDLKFNNPYILLFAAMPIFAYLLAMIWSAFFETPLSGVGIVKTPAQVWKWLLYWGPFLTFFVIYLGSKLVKYEDGNLKIALNSKHIFYLIIFLISIFFWILVETIYFKDLLKDGDWYRANTVFKVGFQIWLWGGMVLGPVVTWIIFKMHRNIATKLIALGVVFILIIQFTYPFLAIKQSNLSGREMTSLESGLDWWRSKNPSDFEAFLFLRDIRDSLPENDKIRVIVEAEGDSFQDNNFFSTFLGWPTIIGWAGHEWTWWGSYDEPGRRREEVKQIYTGTNLTDAQMILEKYNVDYIVIGEIETLKYGSNLKLNKLMNLGSVVFQNEDTTILQVNK